MDSLSGQREGEDQEMVKGQRSDSQFLVGEVHKERKIRRGNKVLIKNGGRRSAEVEKGMNSLKAVKEPRGREEGVDWNEVKANWDVEEERMIYE